LYIVHPVIVRFMSYIQSFNVIHLLVSFIPAFGNCRFHLWKRSFPPLETHLVTARMEVYGCLIYNLHKVTDNKSIRYGENMEDASFLKNIV